MKISTKAFRCSNCGALNRYVSKAGKRPLCGKCKTPFDPHPQDIDQKGLDKLIAKSPVPVLVDFWAGWCGPCRMAAPIVDRIADDMKGDVIVVKVDTEANRNLAARHQIQSLPTFAVFAEGREKARQLGLMPEPTMKSWVQSQL
ncbi:MAG: thioredoxin [Myxococcota bacterium]